VALHPNGLAESAFEWKWKIINQTTGSFGHLKQHFDINGGVDWIRVLKEFENG